MRKMYLYRQAPLFLLLLTASLGTMSAQVFQKKFPPLASPYGYAVTRSFSSMAQDINYFNFLTFSNDSGMSLLSVSRNGSLIRGYDLIPDNGSAIKNKENIASWNCIIDNFKKEDQRKIYGIGTYHIDGTSSDSSFPVFYKLSPMLSQQGGIEVRQLMLIKMKRPAFSSQRNYGGGNDIQFVRGRNIGILQNFIPYRKLRPLVKNVTTSTYNHEEDISLMELDTAGNLQWGNVYIDSTLSVINQKKTQVGLSMMYAQKKIVVTGLATSVVANTSGCSNKYDMLMMKTDSLGVLEWAKTYHHGRISKGYKVFESPSHTYFIIGITNGEGCSSTNDSSSIFMTEMDNTGAIIRSLKYFPGPKLLSTRPGGWDVAHFDAAPSTNWAGGFVITAGAFSRFGTDVVVSAFEIDLLGRVRWARTYDKNTQDNQFRIGRCFEGGYAMTSFRNSVYTGKAMGFIKMDNSGYTYCQEKDTLIHRDTMEWSDITTLNLMTVSDFVFSSLKHKKKNAFLDQNSCIDEGASHVNPHFTINTNHCVCNQVELVSETTDGADFFVDDNLYLGHDDAVITKRMGAGTHRINVTSLQWPYQQDTTLYVTLYDGVHAFDITPGSGLSYTFAFTGWPSDMLSYEWDFGDGSKDSSNTSILHTYSQPGTYEICLTVNAGKPDEHCTSKVCRTLCIHADSNDCCNCELEVTEY